MIECFHTQELLTIIRSLYQMLGSSKRSLADHGDNSSAFINHTDQIFQKLDVNQQGVVTLEEFCQNCANVRMNTDLTIIIRRVRTSKNIESS